MTENEAIKQLEFARILSDLPKEKEAIEMAIQVLEEIEQYRAIGTVEEIKEIRNKAIDDFAEALKKTYSPIYETDTDMCKMVFKRFDEIAEQLKKGGAE